MTTSSSTSSANRLLTRGFGQVEQIDEVTPQNGSPFLACKVKALCGTADKPNFQRFETKVTGSKAQHLVRKCKKAVEAKSIVMIRFLIEDVWPQAFKRLKGPKAGSAGAVLKGNLVFISEVEVDGVSLWKTEANALEELERDRATPPKQAGNGVQAPSNPSSLADFI